MRVNEKLLTQEEIDTHIGQKLKLGRLMAGKTLDEVGKVVGVSFQQVQKYERGKNSISCSRLYYLAKSLNVGVDFFFDQIISRTQVLNDCEVLNIDANDKDLVMLIKNYYSLKDDNVRKKVMELVKSLAE